MTPRWPDPIGREFVALPVALLRYADALGLNDGDVRLLCAMEAYRRGGADEAVFPKQETLADLCGCDVRTVRKRISRLSNELHLIEVERAARGGRRVNHYTRRGLTARLARLVAQEADAPSSSPGYRTDAPSSDRAGTSSRYRADPPPEVEAGEAEARDHAARDLAEAVLAEFNERAGTSYELKRSGEHVFKCVFENRDLTLADYRTILDAEFAKPWWKTTPSPNVIFKPEQFEKARQALTRRPSEQQRADSEADDAYARFYAKVHGTPPTTAVSGGFIEGSVVEEDDGSADAAADAAWKLFGPRLLAPARGEAA